MIDSLEDGIAENEERIKNTGERILIDKGILQELYQSMTLLKNIYGNGNGNGNGNK